MRKGYSTNNQHGQTLIETLVAIFILVMGITTAVQLAIYAFGSSTSITKQIIATGLAREGMEAVRNMRDTNWLRDTLATNCTSYVASSANCYKNWLGDLNNNIAPYCLRPTKNNGNCKGDLNPLVGYYTLDINPNNTGSGNSSYWNLNEIQKNGNGNTWQTFGLNSNSNISNGPFYIPSNTAAGTSDYYRKITITNNTTSPFDNVTYQEVQVTVDVWWVDKNCPRVVDYTPGMKCSVELNTNLTNWRDY